MGPSYLSPTLPQRLPSNAHLTFVLDINDDISHSSMAHLCYSESGVSLHNHEIFRILLLKNVISNPIPT